MRRVPFPLLVYGVALILRLIPVIAAADLGIGLDDMFQYDMLARSLASGNGYRWYQPQDLMTIVRQLRVYTDFDTSNLPTDPRGIPTSFRAPLYPAFLAVIYFLFGLGRRFFAARLAHAFVTATLSPLTYALSKRLGANEARARLAAFVPALWPMLIAYPLGLATENLFIPLLAAGLLVLFISIESGRTRDFALAGVIFGLATLTRSVIVGFPILAAVWLWWRGLRRQALVMVAVILALTLPWAVRNSLLHRRPMFVESSMGYNLYLGYHPQGDGSFKFGISLDLVTILDDSERDNLGREMALQFIRDNPPRAGWLVARKLGHLWGLEDRAFAYFYSNGLLGEWPWWGVVGVFAVIMLPLVLLLPLSTLGLAYGEKNANWWLSAILLAYYSGMHMLIMAEERFHLALVPLLAALGARGLTLWPEIWHGLRARRVWTWRLAGLVGLVLLLLALNWGLEIASHAGRITELARAGGSATFYDY